MKIIGLTGGMGVGKSTAVEVLKELYSDKDVILIKFAQPLYDIQEYIYDRISAAHTRSFHFTKDRYLLQFLGTDWGRFKIKNTLWIDLWKNEVRSYILGYRYKEVIIVADDVRFDNEADAINNLGGSVIEIISQEASARIDTSHAGHISENGLDPELVKYAITNNGTLEAYKNALARTFKLALSDK